MTKPQEPPRLSNQERFIFIYLTGSLGIDIPIDELWRWVYGEKSKLPVKRLRQQRIGRLISRLRVKRPKYVWEPGALKGTYRARRRR